MMQFFWDSWDHYYRNYINTTTTTTATTDCNPRGVVHVLTPNQILSIVMALYQVPNASSSSSSYEEEFTTRRRTMRSMALEGVNVSWFLDCHPVVSSANNHPNHKNKNNTCFANDEQHNAQQHVPPRRCFRGIHDRFASRMELKPVIELGTQLIYQGGDHHDIYQIRQSRKDDNNNNNTSTASGIPVPLEPLVERLQRWLIEVYQVPAETLHPVAFRVGAQGPMDAKGVVVRQPPSSSSSSQQAYGRPFQSVASQPSLVQLLNLTNYARHVETVGTRNGLAQFSLPWPLRMTPYRDECHLLADAQVDSRFAIHTMIFLSEGGGGTTHHRFLDDFVGGQTLLVDSRDGKTTARRRQRIRHGVVIEGAQGRLVVSTGGYENRRCRLPLRRGIRAALQIWWDY